MDGSNHAALGLALERAAPLAHPRDADATAWHGLVLGLLLGLLPVGYVLILLRDGGGLEDGRGLHLALNWLCNLLVAGAAWRAHGPVRVKLGRSWNAAFLFHGALAFFVLGSRVFFSRSLMLAAFAASAVLALLVVGMRHRARGLKIAVAAPERAMAGGMVGGVAVAALGDVVTSPDQDLRAYDVVLLPMDAPLGPQWSAAVSRAMLSGAQVRHVAEYLEEARGRASVEHFHVEHLRDMSLASYETGKRAMDVAMVVFFAPLIVPLVAATALAIRVAMGGPVLFVQERAGRGGRPFRMYKFRTMRPAGDEVRTTSASDDRVTPLGRILRRYRLDETPQLWNVLKGDMSLIGPRPEWTVLNASYVNQMPAYAYRNLVRPGLTGWAQVRSGYAGDLAETRVKLSYDLFYVKNLSLALDLQILARTVWTLLSGSGVR